MTRTYTAKRLLEHGPLTFGELVTITGWTVSQCRKTVECLRRTGVVITAAQQAGRSVYALMEAA